MGSLFLPLFEQGRSVLSRPIIPAVLLAVLSVIEALLPAATLDVIRYPSITLAIVLGFWLIYADGMRSAATDSAQSQLLTFQRKRHGYDLLNRGWQLFRQLTDILGYLEHERMPLTGPLPPNDTKALIERVKKQSEFVTATVVAESKYKGLEDTVFLFGSELAAFGDLPALPIKPVMHFDDILALRTGLAQELHQLQSLVT